MAEGRCEAGVEVRCFADNENGQCVGDEHGRLFSSRVTPLMELSKAAVSFSLPKL